MPRPDRTPDPHLVPTQRQVLITALDKRTMRGAVSDLLAVRGFDLSLPYTQVEHAGEGDLYVQDIPPDEAV